MNLTIALSLLMQLVADAPQIIAIWNAATSNKSAVSKITETIPLSAPILEQIGAALFPKLASDLHIVAGAVSVNLTAVQWVQESMNILAKPVPPLAVDGKIGPKTLAAIHAFQAQHGFPVTGFLSDAEDALIMQLLSKV